MTNVISADFDADKHYRHSGFSATISSSYASPAGGPVGLTWDGANVISADFSALKHYLHSGFSATISSSYASPSALPRGVTWDGANVISADSNTDRHYLHSGFSATISSSYASPSTSPQGVTWDGRYISNTGPSFSAQPAASYNSGFTRTGPSNTPVSVLFTATDAEQTGAGELSYEVRTSATPGGGTLVGSGTCTSGAQKSHSLAYNASGLVDGSNTLYVHLSDGIASVVVSSSFTVLRDDVAPTDSTSISVTPDPLPTPDTTYEVGFQPNDAASIGAGEMRASLYRNTGSSGFLKGLIGLTSGGAALFESVGNDTELVPGVNTRYIVARDGAGNTKETSFTVTVDGGDLRRRLLAGTPGSGMHRAPGSPTVW